MTTDAPVLPRPRQEPTAARSPAIGCFAHLKPRNSIGVLFVTLATAVTCVSIYLSTFQHPLIWATAQITLAFAMLQWFVLLHEAGHKTLFKSVRLNKYTGHLASLLAGIPFECWKIVHGMHHHWTGWQDLDATTATLVPRPLSWGEKLVVNVCWRFWIPLFSVLYRVQNYWNLPRLYRLFPRPPQRRKLTCNLLLLLAVYATTAYLVGITQLLQIFGLALFLTLVMQDILILSQHTHIPMELSHGDAVAPFSPADQEVFTRSLKFPTWFSTLVLLNMDAHELHHVYTSVPGYYLRRIEYDTQNSVSWWRWLWKAKRVSGEVFLFQNRNQSGFDI